jgi:hypothetical protein
MHKLTTLVVALAGCSMALAGAAAADTGKSPHLAAPSNAPATGKLAAPLGADALLGKAPRGYVQVIGSSVTVGAGLQERAQAFCPTGKVPVGGGGVIASSDVRANVNSSLPLANGWAIDVNNASGASTTASARVICIKQPRKYQVVSVSGIANPAGSESAGIVSCPTGTAVLGGGALSQSTDLTVNLNSSFPLSAGNGWRSDVSNASTSSSSFAAFAICAKQPNGYAVLSSGDVTATPGTEAAAFVSCAGNAVPLGGGLVSFDSDLHVNVNSLRPEAHGWTSFLNNASAFGAPFDARVVCAGA